MYQVEVHIVELEVAQLASQGRNHGVSRRTGEPQLENDTGVLVLLFADCAHLVFTSLKGKPLLVVHFCVTFHSALG